ncbi:transposase for insertion sequence element IS4351 [Neisseria meningitidis M01-240355]|nr:transposase for insertion sequence element IS4351 [Neisseria meningitidis M01-240149]ADY99063.1 transposase for insertion sequence element IS4351 [Neisseria meningitidis M01-240355]EGC52482.1 transposase for insertion sequence element IS4351 [Neisseria meningitidis OX99.30304]RPD18950.1 IS30 family transposase [Neisseria meningitidis]
MAKTLKAETYFYRPYHSWEKGLNENTNGLIRQYSPNKPFSETSAIGRYVGFKMS